MAIPLLVEPFVEPEAERQDAPWWLDRLTAAPLASAATVVALGLLLWEDISRKGPWPGLPGPLDLSRLPLSLNGAWLFAGFAIALAVGIALGRRSSTPLSQPDDRNLPRLPVFLRFDGRRVVVVGAGAVAASKIPALLAAGADVTVVAPDVSSAIDRSRVRVVQRAFQDGDLDGAWFVTAAAPPAVNRAVREAAETRGVFVNAVDDPANATAFLGGTIARGGVTVAFSTAGQAPALAGLLREAFDELVPADIATWAERAHDLSRRQRDAGVPMPARRPQLLDALNRLYDSPDRATRPR
ncbi:MAG: bifunctional precorrin-2 dehydrogenase/sirohydrochlorin ferrochelatase [Acidobacteriota bacterium]|nr:bifunctional precorrin-2 dehydrogenase/sirohydrochlorin ferrochelatase [Acidobacteriota bacterium]